MVSSLGPHGHVLNWLRSGLFSTRIALGQGQSILLCRIEISRYFDSNFKNFKIFYYSLFIEKWEIMMYMFYYKKPVYKKASISDFLRRIMFLTVIFS